MIVHAGQGIPTERLSTRARPRAILRQSGRSCCGPASSIAWTRKLPAFSLVAKNIAHAACGSLPQAPSRRSTLRWCRCLKGSAAALSRHARDPNRRTRMTRSAVSCTRRAGRTDWQVAWPASFHDATRSPLHTGRTQIRVHFSALDTPCGRHALRRRRPCTSAAQRCHPWDAISCTRKNRGRPRARASLFTSRAAPALSCARTCRNCRGRSRASGTMRCAESFL